MLRLKTACPCRRELAAGLVESKTLAERLSTFATKPKAPRASSPRYCSYYSSSCSRTSSRSSATSALSTRYAQLYQNPSSGGAMARGGFRGPQHFRLDKLRISGQQWRVSPWTQPSQCCTSQLFATGLDACRRSNATGLETVTVGVGARSCTGSSRHMTTEADRAVKRGNKNVASVDGGQHEDNITFETGKVCSESTEAIVLISELYSRSPR